MHFLFRTHEFVSIRYSEKPERVLTCNPVRSIVLSNTVPGIWYLV